MRYTAKKIATMLLTMVIVSFLTFVAFSLLSGDAATRLLGTEATPERLEALRIELGLNDPLLVRYGRWLWDALRGDLGTSYRYGQSVSSLIAQRLGPTLTLTALAFAPLDGGQQQPPETGDGEHLLDDDAAREQIGDRHGEEGQDRHERVFQHMAVEDAAARASAAHGGAA